MPTDVLVARPLAAEWQITAHQTITIVDGEAILILSLTTAVEPVLQVDRSGLDLKTTETIPGVHTTPGAAVRLATVDSVALVEAVGQVASVVGTPQEEHAVEINCRFSAPKNFVV